MSLSSKTLSRGRPCLGRSVSWTAIACPRPRRSRSPAPAPRSSIRRSCSVTCSVTLDHLPLSLVTIPEPDREGVHQQEHPEHQDYSRRRHLADVLLRPL